MCWSPTLQGVRLSQLINCAGRLLYTTGDTAGAVRYFLGLLRESPPLRLTRLTGLGLSIGETTPDGRAPTTDRVYLEDFRVALKVALTVTSA